MEATSKIPENQRYIPLSQFNRYFDYPSVPALRNMIFHADKTGIDCCILRLGRRILIDIEKFNQWIEQQGEGVN